VVLSWVVIQHSLECESDILNQKMELQGGDKYKQNYREKEELGRGRFGVVFKVEEKSTGKIFAAKHIKTRKKEQKQEALEEVKLLKKLSDPHIIHLVTAYEKHGGIIVVLEYLDGGELFEKVADEEYELTEAACSLFLKQICAGVQYLHSKRVVHLDLKPENIVCIENNDETNIKIIDFGTAKILDPEKKINVFCGTAEFLSPEVVNYEFIDLATDMWSVGVICYILLSGFSPFVGESDEETSANITSGRYDFDCDEFDIISDNAKDFINELLQNSMVTRMTATECLAHPWLVGSGDGGSGGVIQTVNLRKFLARRRWQRCGQAMRAMTRMSSLVVKRKTSSEDFSEENKESEYSTASVPNAEDTGNNGEDTGNNGSVEVNRSKKPEVAEVEKTESTNESSFFNLVNWFRW